MLSPTDVASLERVDFLKLLLSELTPSISLFVQLLLQYFKLRCHKDLSLSRIKCHFVPKAAWNNKGDVWVHPCCVSVCCLLAVRPFDPKSSKIWHEGQHHYSGGYRVPLGQFPHTWIKLALILLLGFWQNFELESPRNPIRYILWFSPFKYLNYLIFFAC